MKTLLAISALFTFMNTSAGQSNLIGLWVVDEVFVGDQNLTPTAKWFLYQTDGTLTAGNGGMENLIGTFTFQTDNNELTHNNGQEPDPYGPFKTNLNQEKMTWERMEDGMKVVVQLTKVDKKPKAPWDLIQGSWVENYMEIHHKNTNTVDITDLDDPSRFFFMWDRAYRTFNSSGQQIETGVWHIGGHSNEIWTIANSDNTKTKWQLSFENDGMVWSQQKGNELVKVYFEKSND